MWHHEDAGIGFNVFRAVVSANASASLVPVPGHYNDPGIIERSVPLDANDEYWSTRRRGLACPRLPSPAL